MENIARDKMVFQNFKDWSSRIGAGGWWQGKNVYFSFPSNFSTTQMEMRLRNSTE